LTGRKIDVNALILENIDTRKPNFRELGNYNAWTDSLCSETIFLRKNREGRYLLKNEATRQN
jgi:hypothetical protein